VQIEAGEAVDSVSVCRLVGMEWLGKGLESNVGEGADNEEDGLIATADETPIAG
jgi:hypothetical protein